MCFGLLNKNRNRLEGELQSDYHGLEADVRQRLITCCHCQLTFRLDPKGKSPEGFARGWCGRCMGHVCGTPVCRARGCVHWEEQLQNLEEGKDPGFKRIIAHVPGEVPVG